MPRFLTVILFTSVLAAQAPVPEINDPLGRSTPQSSMFQFLEVCHARNYSRALRYFDLRRMTQAERAKEGLELAHQLEDLLDDTPFDIATLSHDSQGDLSDSLPADLDRLDTFHIAGKTLELRLQRIVLKPGLRVWLVSADSFSMIHQAHQLVTESPFEKRLPQPLVTVQVFDTPVWRWLALLLAGVLLWMATSLLLRLIVRMLRSMVDATDFRSPVTVCLTAAGMRAAMGIATPSALPRLFLERALGMIFFLGVAWAGTVAVEFIAERWQSRLDPRLQSLSYSVLPLGKQILKLSLFLVAILSVVSAWGYNTSTILAGLGVGGLAVALAAQKTIENLFGGVSVIGDRPVLVGDVCRFGDRTGTVMHIGLRSTRIRTPERTIVSVPNGQFSSMVLENISGRDKIWFHMTFNLRRDTTSDQMLQVLSSCREVLAHHPKVDIGKVPIRFIGVGAYSLDVEVAVYVITADYDEYLPIQQELLLKILQAIERAGTGLAVPMQESFGGKPMATA